MSDEIRHPGQLVAWLKANVLASISLSIVLVGAIVTISYTIVHWIDTQAHQIELNQTAVVNAAHDVALLQANIVSLDGRINELRARMVELHSLSEQVSAQLKARLDIMDALNRYTAERAMQPNIPTPKGTNR